MRYFLALSLLVALLWQCRTPTDQTSAVLDSGTTLTSTATWAISGYTRESPTRKQWIVIEDGTIKTVQELVPAGLAADKLIDTDDHILPGLFDMHNHLGYNILPLWNLARGQFLNRFEWRTKYLPYKKAVGFNMTPIKDGVACAATRYAEIRALSGGATAVQGVGGGFACGAGFGVRNLESSGEFGKNIAKSITDIIDPYYIGKVYNKHIAPDQLAAGTYDRAFTQYLNKQKLDSWIQKAQQAPRNFSTALELALGENIRKYEIVNKSDVTKYEKLQTKTSARATTLLKKLSFRETGNPAAAKVDLENLLKQPDFGDLETGDYSKYRSKLAKFIATHTTNTAVPLQEPDAMDLIGDDGIAVASRINRKYVSEYEQGVRRRALKSLSDPQTMAVIAHLSEGRRDDRYNQSEYEYLQKLGLANPGMILIHGVGMDKNQLAHAGANNISIVWSPFSNLLLYNQTLDVVAARAAGVNLTIGSDWGPTGSKHLLDEFKIARRYLDANGINISNDELVDMATVNAAKALRINDRFGAIRPGYAADLIVIKRTTQKPADDVVQATQKDMRLVVVAGHPTFGDPDLINKTNVLYPGETPEIIATTSQTGTCNFQKGLRLPGKTTFDDSLQQTDGNRYRSYKDVWESVTKAMDAFATKVRAGQLSGDPADLVSPAPLFSCDDQDYTTRLTRFIGSELNENAGKKVQLRRDGFLSDSWSPITN